MKVAPDKQQTYLSWEEAVLWLKQQPDQKALVRDCYFDDPLEEAASRFYKSPEWQSARNLLPHPCVGARALDLGAGRGIASYALARDGWNVTALEPDPSRTVGAGAIRQLATDTGTCIKVVEDWGEKLPFPNAHFAVVHARQVLHHAKDLERLCSEVYRVLSPGGVLLAPREHVISREGDLDAFLASHPLHSLYGGENAYTLARYLSAIKEAGFGILHVLSPWESDINLFPKTFYEIRIRVAHQLRFPFPSLIPVWMIHHQSRRLDTPGRLYTFMGVKP